MFIAIILTSLFSVFLLGPLDANAQLSAGTTFDTTNYTSYWSSLNIYSSPINEITSAVNTTLSNFARGDITSISSIASDLSQSLQRLKNEGRLFSDRGNLIERETKYQFRETTNNSGCPTQFEWKDDRNLDASRIEPNVKCCFQVRARDEQSGDISDWSNERCRVGPPAEDRCDYQGSSNGVCRNGVLDSEGNCTEPRSYYEEEESSCDKLDNDCDGQVDESLVRSCGPNTTLGQCRKGTRECTDGSWGSCQGAQYSSSESCNNTDDDCDGRIDDGSLCGSSSRCESGSCEEICRDTGNTECNSSGNVVSVDSCGNRSLKETCEYGCSNGSCDSRRCVEDAERRCEDTYLGGEKVVVYDSCGNQQREIICGDGQTCESGECVDESPDCPDSSEICGEQECGSVFISLPDCPSSYNCGTCSTGESCSGGICVEETCNYNGETSGVCGDAVLDSEGNCQQPSGYANEEVCGDELDNDCDGETDEGCGGPTCPQDAEPKSDVCSTIECGEVTESICGETYNCGSCGTGEVCDSGTCECNDGDNDGFDDSACGGSDCDDNDPDINPNTTWYKDADRDGYYSSTRTQCERPSGEGWIFDAPELQSGDCNDNNDDVYPGAEEICDGVDNDCLGKCYEYSYISNNRTCRSNSDCYCGRNDCSINNPCQTVDEVC